jgi:hypothetical protein
MVCVHGRFGVWSRAIVEGISSPEVEVPLFTQGGEERFNKTIKKKIFVWIRANWDKNPEKWHEQVPAHLEVSRAHQLLTQ